MHSEPSPSGMFGNPLSKAFNEVLIPIQNVYKQPIISGNTANAPKSWA
jgi:hypothetical protein